jgi:hypothetical protein
MSSFDRSAEDVGNVLSLEHVNVTVPDQGLAALFYVSGLGFTRDPYVDFGLRNMWVNVGAQQFHLPLGEPQVFRGRIFVVVPDLDDLERRLGRIAKPLAGTRFAFAREGEHVRVTCPWGNDIRACGPGAFAGVTLGIPHLEVDVAPGRAAGIGRFYRLVMGCPVTTSAGRASVRLGHDQTLAFSETDAPIPPYDGHHVAVYLANFSGPHGWLRARGLVTEESDRHQYRFQAIVDPDSGETLAELEHEVRSVAHPMFHRPLVNRNPAVGFLNYRQGDEVFTPP